jgi:asparagine synthase (glutamine-hydrolysing)
MCGILAVLGDTSICNKDEVNKSLNVITHRGPNDFGIVTFEQAVLGFRRLSIIDLSKNGHQPMSDYSGRYWIIFNGEIYNFIELRKKIINHGFAFRSESDTEVILNGYLCFGEKIVEYLHGMFAFVIYDSLAGTAFMARDRMGKKPLLYYKFNNTLIVFSELKQIIQFNFFSKEVNYSIIPNFLKFGSIPSPNTILKDVYQLPAGTFANFSNSNFNVSVYWEPKINKSYTNIDYKTATEILQDLLTDSVKSRMISDVPIGAFLSGGLDSSIITALMAKSTNKLNTFSIDFSNESKNFNETYYSKIVAKHFGTNHQNITITQNDLVNDLDKIIWHIDQPSCDAINTFYVSKAASSSVTVALSGVGSDEVFFGYSHYKFINLLNSVPIVKNLSKCNLKTSTELFRHLPQQLKLNWNIRLLFASIGAFPSLVDKYNLIKDIYNINDKNKLLLNEDFINSDSINNFHFCNNNLTDLQKISLIDLNNYLKNTLLRDTDIMGMANSIEIRCPFIDHRIIEFALSIPDAYKISKINTKRILKDSFKDLLPREIIDRKKMGFAFPLSQWLKSNEFRIILEDCLSESTISKRGLFNFKYIDKIKKSFLNSKNDGVRSYQLYQKIWTLIVLELWFRKYTD